MRALEESMDGFVIAEKDLTLRGPGEQFGTRQSGHVRFRLADPYQDTELLQKARKAAHTTYDSDPGLQKPEHHILKKEIARQFERVMENRPS